MSENQWLCLIILYIYDKLISHDVDEKYEGTAFDVGTSGIYEDVYYAITENKSLGVTCEQAAQVIRIIEIAHAQNPHKIKYL